MRLLKRILRRLYHLIAFLSLFIVFTDNVNAATGSANTNGTIFHTSPYVWLYDNTNEHLTSVNTTWNSTGKYYSATLTYNGASTAGANVILTTLEPIMYGYTYSLSILVGGNTNFKPSTNRVCIAENGANTITRWERNMCVTPSFMDSIGTSDFTVVDSSYPNTIGYSVLYYVFTSNITARSVTVAFNSQTAGITTTTVVGGYNLQLLSDNNQLTQGQLQSAIQNSGLATANSVAQVQSSINQVQQQLSGVQNSVDDVNDTLNDSTVDSSDNTINGLKQNIPSNNVISSLILLPVKFLQAIVNSLGGTCSSFNLGSLYNHNLVLPCINIENYLGSTIWTFIDLVFSSMFILAIRKKFIQIYQNITNLRNGVNEVD